MRVKQPEPFDREREYKPGERAIVNGAVLIATLWTPAAQMEKQPERKREYKKPEAFDVPKEVEAMAEFFGEMFPGTTVEIHRVEMPRRNPRDKRRGKNKRKGGRHNEK